MWLIRYLLDVEWGSRSRLVAITARVSMERDCDVLWRFCERPTWRWGFACWLKIFTICLKIYLQFFKTVPRARGVACRVQGVTEFKTKQKTATYDLAVDGYVPIQTKVCKDFVMAGWVVGWVSKTQLLWEKKTDTGLKFTTMQAYTTIKQCTCWQSSSPCTMNDALELI